MQTTKTIALVANTTWNIYNFRLNVIRKFIAEGYSVIVFSPIDEFIHYKKEFSNVQHVSINSLDRDGTNPLKDLALVLELKRLYQKYQPDLILHYTIKPNIYGAVAARLVRIPSVGIVTGLGYSFLHKGLISSISRWLYQISLRYHKKVIFENQDDRMLFIEQGITKEENSISIKGCGVNTKHYIPLSSEKSRKTIFSFLGRLLYDKGIQEFAEAAEIVKRDYDDVEFWLVGDIDDQNPASVKKEDILAWVKQGIVLYHGSTTDVRTFISESSCIVLPSYREAIARSLTEAMAMERPVIATDVAGCREAIKEGCNGYLVKVKDANSLAEAFVSFIHLTHDERAEMGKNGRQMVLEEFDDRLIAKDIYNICRDILNPIQRH